MHAAAGSNIIEFTINMQLAHHFCESTAQLKLPFPFLINLQTPELCSLHFDTENNCS